ncbi:MAG TPA: hypothetical protein VIL18_02705 [Longimicrobiales bacterium]
MWIFSFLSSPRMADADAELRAELREFAYDGLIQLAADLERGVVKRGTWDGCVLSYRRGFAGSVDSDRKGRRGNAFTRFWDAERVDEQHVLRMVREEIEARRAGQRPAPEPAEPAAVS